MRVKFVAALLTVQLGLLIEVRAEDGDHKDREKPGVTDVQPDVERPALPERPDHGKSESLKNLLNEFKTRAAELRSRRKDLAAGFRGGSEEERAEVRQQLLQVRAELKQNSREFHDQIQELAGRLKEQSKKIAEEKSEMAAKARRARH